MELVNRENLREVMSSTIVCRVLEVMSLVAGSVLLLSHGIKFGDQRLTRSVI